jgi:hypothetical protein
MWYLSSIWYRFRSHISITSFVFIFSFKTLNAYDSIYTCVLFSSLWSECRVCVYTRVLMLIRQCFHTRSIFWFFKNANIFIWIYFVFIFSSIKPMSFPRIRRCRTSEVESANKALLHSFIPRTGMHKSLYWRKYRVRHSHSKFYVILIQRCPEVAKREGRWRFFGEFLKKLMKNCWNFAKLLSKKNKIFDYWGKGPSSLNPLPSRDTPVLIL